MTAHPDAPDPACSRPGREAGARLRRGPPGPYAAKGGRRPACRSCILLRSFPFSLPPACGGTLLRAYRARAAGRPRFPQKDGAGAGGAPSPCSYPNTDIQNTSPLREQNEDISDCAAPAGDRRPLAV